MTRSNDTYRHTPRDSTLSRIHDTARGHGTRTDINVDKYRRNSNPSAKATLSDRLPLSQTSQKRKATKFIPAPLKRSRLENASNDLTQPTNHSLLKDTSAAHNNHNPNTSRRPKFYKACGPHVLQGAINKGVIIPNNKSLSQLGYARGHTLSYKDIKKHVDEAINTHNLNIVYILITEKLKFQAGTPEFRKVMALYEKFDRLITQKLKGELTSKGIHAHKTTKALVSALNSCLGNLALSDGRTNSSIGARLDPNIIVNQDNSLSLTPKSKELIERGPQDPLVSKPCFITDENRTPKIKSSKLNKTNTYQHSINSFTPGSQRSLKNSLKATRLF